MEKMTHRERVVAALNHQQPDRCPVDFGGTYVTTATDSAYDILKNHLGLTHETRFCYKKRLGLVEPHISVLERFDIDTRMVAIRPYVGSQKVIDENTVVDEWGTTWNRAEDGHFLYVDGPFFNQKKPDIAEIENGQWPDPDDPSYYEGLVESAKAQRATDCAVILNMHVGGVHQAQFVRGFGDWLKDLYKNREFSARLMEMVTDRWVAVAENAIDLVGDYVDIVFVGDDVAIQQGPMFDPQIYREQIKPYHERMISAVKAKADVKFLFHCCGGISQLLDDFIDVGIDAVNPVQVAAEGMDPRELKDRFGERVAFWGGIDTQGVLPFGTPEEVRAEVRRIIDILGEGGGLILNSVHNIQEDVPPENIVAMFDEAREYSGPV